MARNRLELLMDLLYGFSSMHPALWSHGDYIGHRFIEGANTVSGGSPEPSVSGACLRALVSQGATTIWGYLGASHLLPLVGIHKFIRGMDVPDNFCDVRERAMTRHGSLCW